MLRNTLRKLYLRNVKSSIRKCWTAAVSRDKHVLTVSQQGRKENLEFPLLWLRDTCQCGECFDRGSHSKINLLKDWNKNAEPEYAKISSNEAGKLGLEIKWPDNHQSFFELDWLEDHSFDANRQRNWLQKNYRVPKITWDANQFKDILKTFDFGKILKDDRELLDWLNALDVYGLAIVKNASAKEGQLDFLADRVGYLKRTYYGKYYAVQVKEDAKNIAYLPKPLQLHNDLPYFEYCPGVNMLHFLVQSPEGGENPLSDSFRSCQLLQEQDRSSYDILRSTIVDWSDLGQDNGYEFHSIYRAPVICENQDGEVYRVNFSQPQRDSHFNVSIKEAIDWYEAKKVFINLVYSPENYVEIKMEQGDILTFDNWRILHGRNAHGPGRKVQGAYMDWDVVRSKIRVLKKKIETPK